MAKMTQTQIITEMATKSGLSKKQVKEFITDLIELAYRDSAGTRRPTLKSRFPQRRF
jgi:hypothetical protein